MKLQVSKVDDLLKIYGPTNHLLASTDGNAIKLHEPILREEGEQILRIHQDYETWINSLI